MTVPEFYKAVQVFLKTGVSVDEGADIDVLYFLSGAAYSLQTGRGD